MQYLNILLIFPASIGMAAVLCTGFGTFAIGWIERCVTRRLRRRAWARLTREVRAYWDRQPPATGGPFRARPTRLVRPHEHQWTYPDDGRPCFKMPHPKGIGGCCRSMTCTSCGAEQDRGGCGVCN